MGYNYDFQGRLVCDFCGQAGGVRKLRCPFRWCPAPAACPACRKAHKALWTKAAHRDRGCEAHAAEWRRRNEELSHLIAEGKYVRASALAVDTDRGRKVHVLFRGRDGWRGYLMDHATYDALPLLDSCTVEDYAALGELIPAAPAFSQGRTTKEITPA